jgi:GntR family transcriptional regulator
MNVPKLQPPSGERQSGLGRMDGVPLHRQLFLVLRSAILSGLQPPGSDLPTEEALVQSYQVSRSTVRRALSSLQGEGLIERKRGSGTRVARTQSGLPAETPLKAHREAVASVAAVSVNRSMVVETVPAPEFVREALALDIPCRVMRIKRVRTVEGVPIWYTIAHFSHSVAPVDLHSAQGKSLLEVIEESGITIGEIDESIGAVLADHEVAEQLEIGIGAPVLETFSTVISEDGEPVSVNITYTAPERRRVRIARRSDIDPGLSHGGESGDLPATLPSRIVGPPENRQARKER